MWFDPERYNRYVLNLWERFAYRGKMPAQGPNHDKSKWLKWYFSGKTQKQIRENLK